MRLLLELVLPALIPVLVYLGWLRVERRRAAAAGEGSPLPWWAETPWLALAGAGVLLAALVLSVIVMRSGDAINGVYIPAQIENGTLVPGHVEYPLK
ncbi:MAG: DUF6111 family protein [Rhodospirillaceae bacterium]